MLILQRMTLADFPAYLAMKSDPEDVKWSGFASPPTPDQFRKLFEGWLVDPKRIMFVARANSAVGYYVINIEGGDADTSYGVAAAHRGFGHGAKMNICAVRWAQQELPGLRLTSWIAEDHDASKKSVVSAGFSPTTETRARRFLLPRPHDKVMRLYLYGAAEIDGVGRSAP